MGVTRLGDSDSMGRRSSLPAVIFKAGQKVRVRVTGSSGKVFLKLPSEEVYLVQMPGFPVVEKVYYGSDLEPLDSRGSRAAARRKK